MCCQSWKLPFIEVISAIVQWLTKRDFPDFIKKKKKKRKSNSPVAAVVAAVGKPIDLYFLASHEEQTLQQPHSSWTWFKYSIRPMIYHYIWRMTMNIKWLKSIHFESSVLHDLQFAQFYDTENREEHCFKSEWTLICKKIPYFLI